MPDEHREIPSEYTTDIRMSRIGPRPIQEYSRSECPLEQIALEMILHAINRKRPNLTSCVKDEDGGEGACDNDDGTLAAFKGGH